MSTIWGAYQFEETLNFYWVDGYLIGITDDLEKTKEAIRYATGEQVSILPLSKKSLLYADGAEYDGEMGRILHPEGRSYGPQISLTPGEYEIIIVGENLDNAEIECVSNTDIKISMENLQVSDDVITYEIRLEDIAEKMDFIVANLTDEDIHIKDILIMQYSE